MMVSFLDGPAKGATLNLLRTPRFLRVCLGKKIDALDLLTDDPRPEESLYAYEILPETFCAIDYHDKNNQYGDGISGIISISYRIMHPQPQDSDMRLFAKWKNWCCLSRRLDPVLELQ